MRFLFLINHQLINTIKQEAFQQNQVQLPVQIVNQTPQKQHTKSQKSTVVKTEKPVLSVEQQQQQQKLFEEQQQQQQVKLEEQQNRLLEEQRQKILQQQQDELEQQLKLLEAEEEEHNQRQLNL